jgi:hypothetical protein
MTAPSLYRANSPQRCSRLLHRLCARAGVQVGGVFSSDDATHALFDGAAVDNSGGTHALRTQCGFKTLMSGQTYELVIHLGEKVGAAGLALQYLEPSMAAPSLDLASWSTRRAGGGAGRARRLRRGDAGQRGAAEDALGLGWIWRIWSSERLLGRQSAAPFGLLIMRACRHANY